jgi:hypothetical protein
MTNQSPIKVNMNTSGIAGNALPNFNISSTGIAIKYTG